MDDDLNTPDALAAIFDLVKEINTLSGCFHQGMRWRPPPLPLMS